MQSTVEASPIKWHLAHVTWFFETMVLERALPGVGASRSPFHPDFRMMFNSYYNGIGEFHPRHLRGVLSRPSLQEVFDYRLAVDERIEWLLERLGDDAFGHSTLAGIELGLHHEQQHQELIITDIKHHFSCNPVTPAFITRGDETPHEHRGSWDWSRQASGLFQIGHGGSGFAFDNESPAHRVWIEPFELARGLVTNGEYRAFIWDGGYERENLWLADGWEWIRKSGWKRPLYWIDEDSIFTLSGRRAIDEAEPVCHVSYYEADAYARWAGARLPTEFEWESVARSEVASLGTGSGVHGRFLESGHFHPGAANPKRPSEATGQLLGDCWEWTQSAYLPYPGFRAHEGLASEYNGKFMVNQMVLRGGSCATPQSHIRETYRNFFHPDARRQFSGIRLARS